MMKNLNICDYVKGNVQTYKPFQVELLTHPSNWNQNISVHEEISVEKIPPWKLQIERSQVTVQTANTNSNSKTSLQHTLESQLPASKKQHTDMK